MSELIEQSSYEHSPTLRTVMMVEKTLESAEESLITFADLKKLLPRKVMDYTLKVILDYLEKGGKIVFTSKGITWVYTEPEHLQKLKARGIEL